MIKRTKKAQTALEYILLLMAVVVVVLLGFSQYMPEVQEGANIFYNRAVPAMLGDAPRCGDGFCDAPWETREKCPPDC